MVLEYLTLQYSTLQSIPIVDVHFDYVGWFILNLFWCIVHWLVEGNQSVNVLVGCWQTALLREGRFGVTDFLDNRLREVG